VQEQTCWSRGSGIAGHPGTQQTSHSLEQEWAGNQGEEQNNKQSAKHL